MDIWYSLFTIGTLFDRSQYGNKQSSLFRDSHFHIICQYAIKPRLNSIIIIMPNNYSMRRKITLLAVPILGWLHDVLSKDYFPVLSSSKNIE